MTAALDRQPGAAPVLRDPTLNQELLTNGFVRLPGTHLLDDARTELRSFFIDEFPGARQGFHNDYFLPHADFRRRASAVMAKLTEPLAERWFAGLEPFLYTYLTKFATPESTLDEHRDWMYVDEVAGDRSYILYIALDDADENNGELQLVPRSHLLDGPPCGTRLIWPWLGHGELLRQHAVPLPLRAGEAAIWDNRLIHMSFENRTTSDRFAIGLWCHRPERPLAHFLADPSGQEVRQYAVDRDFFVETTPFTLIDHDPEFPVVGRFTVEWGDFSAATLTNVLNGEDPGPITPWGYRPVLDTAPTPGQHHETDR
jgi:hypothetical protein